MVTWSYLRKHGIWIYPISLAILCTDFGLAATNSELSDEIPPLKPPRGEIPPGFWEQNAIWIITATVLALCVVALAIWFFARKNKPEALPPEVEARAALKSFAGKTETGQVVSEVSRIVRRYFAAAFGLPRQEFTTAEFTRTAVACEPIGPDLAERIGKFLRECDQTKFAIENKVPPPYALEMATKLIKLGEDRREYLRQQEKQKTVNDARQS